MVLNTNLTLSGFNIVKYVVVFLMFDVVVRISLNAIAAFLRSLSLRHGRSVALQPLSPYRFQFHFDPISSFSVPTLLLFALTFGVYITELLLEFSSHSNVYTVTSPDVVNVVKSLQSACSMSDISSRRDTDNLAILAEGCVDVDIEKGNYKFYHFVWETLPDVRPRCIHTENNVLTTGALLYNDNNLHSASSDFIRNLQGTSPGMNDDQNHPIILIRVHSDSILFPKTYDESGEKYISAGISVSLPNTSITCIGNAHGRVGEGQFKVEIYFCFDGSFPKDNSRLLLSREPVWFYRMFLK